MAIMGVIVAAVGALLLPLLGLAVGYGTLRQRVKNLEDKMAKVETLVAQVATIIERTRNTQDEIKSANTKLDSLMAFLLHETRSFVPTPPGPMRA